MQLSTRGRYAVMAMAELAARQRDGARQVTLAEIAASQRLSLCYLEQLFGGLRRAGLVSSARGPGGGYRLGRSPAEMTVADVLVAVEEPLRATRCAADLPGCMPNEIDGHVRCRTHDLWDELGRQIQFFLGAITIEDVVSDRVVGRAARVTNGAPRCDATYAPLGAA